MTAQELIWEAAGRPVVRDPSGVPLVEDALGDCAYCAGHAVHHIAECLSSNFVVAKRLQLGARGLCKACAFCLRDLRLRCAPWMASRDGVTFCRDRWGILEFILKPPAPPFVVGIPWFGIQKGGMGNLDFCRVWHPEREIQLLSPEKLGEDGQVVRAAQVMPKLQSKHTAIFAQTGISQERYPLAADDSAAVLVDVNLWREIAGHVTEALRWIPVPCLEEWIPPRICSDKWRDGIVRWGELTDPLEPYRLAAWWPLLLAIVPRPERPTTKGPLHAID